jgi:acyl dehydratase
MRRASRALQFMKYLEDFRPGEIVTIPGYELEASEIVAFARQWDPQPMHTDPEVANALPFGGLIASGLHLLAIAVRQLVSQPGHVAVIAGLSVDEVRFLHPARPGDTLTVTRECIDARASDTKPDRGIVRNRITVRNQNGDVLTTYIDTLLVSRRPVGATNRATPEIDADRLKRLLRACWSARTSSLWSESNPSRGQCAVTSLVINDHFAGEILKTRVGESWHFYSRIGGRVFDFTSEQFPSPIDYLDVVSSRDEAFADTNEEQYRELGFRFAEALLEAGEKS